MHIIWIIFRNHHTAASSGELADKQSTARESEQDGNDEMERERERACSKWNQSIGMRKRESRG